MDLDFNFGNQAKDKPVGLDKKTKESLKVIEESLNESEDNNNQTIAQVKEELLNKEIPEKEQIEDKLRDFYVKHSSKPTYLETSRRFNLDAKDIALRGREEKWFELRNAFWDSKNADKMESIFSATEEINNGLSIITRFAVSHYAEYMLEIAKERKNSGSEKGEPKIPLREVMSLVKLLKENSTMVMETLEQSMAGLKDLSDNELEGLISEDERLEYGLDV